MLAVSLSIRVKIALTCQQIRPSSSRPKMVIRIIVNQKVLWLNGRVSWLISEKSEQFLHSRQKLWLAGIFWMTVTWCLQMITLYLLILMTKEYNETVSHCSVIAHTVYRQCHRKEDWKSFEGISSSSFCPKMESAVSNLDKSAWTVTSNKPCLAFAMRQSGLLFY